MLVETEMRGEAAGPPVGELLESARRRLAAASATARLDAELLLAHVSGARRATLVAFPERRAETAAAARFESLVARRLQGEPVAYLTGRQGFHAIELEVTPDVLVPRPETELIVDEILARGEAATRTRVLDLGTGSGAIALAVKAARMAWRVTGLDASRAALELAAANAGRLALEIDWRRSDWFERLDDAERFDFVACNPPYVASGDAHFEGPLRHEPRAALDGGPDGLAAIRAVLAGAAAHLAPAGLLLVEHGFDQREAVRELAAARGYTELAAREDLAGRPRLIVLGIRAP